MEEELFELLRYCFQAGYTLPQYCIDNDIKQPIFVMEKKAEWFLKEVHVQFVYDNRVAVPQFCFIDSDNKGTFVYINQKAMFLAPGQIHVKALSEVNLESFDAVIFLTRKNVDLSGTRIITLAELEGFFIPRTYIEMPILNYLQHHPKVKFFMTNFPNIFRYAHKGASEVYAKLWDMDVKALKVALKENNTVAPWDKFGYTSDQIEELIEPAKVVRNSDGTTTLLEDDYPLRGIQNGKRQTAYQPEKFLNKIYLFGTCHQYGTNAPFDKTIESYLQKLLNENNLPYRVENEGQGFTGRVQDMYYNLNKLKPAPGDIILFYYYDMHSNNDIIPFCDISDAFDEVDGRDIHWDKDGHVNELGYKLMAEKYFKFLTENNFFRDVEFNYPLPPPPYHRYGIPSWAEQSNVNSKIVNEELEAYKEQLKAKRAQIGALVMNCNPFTLGHQYLVEYAAARVAKLYIFVVEEDKSEFPFADRMELVKQGVKHLSNVEVLPSGKFIILQTTFSGYFNKAELQDVQVDSSEDVEIFGREIAPTLGITVRFAGEEPTDNVTRQYNETMKEILPRYGVEFCEIPRKEIGGEPISASKVRTALKVGDFDKVKQLVPEMTFLYLRGRFSAIKSEIQLRENWFDYLREQHPKLMPYFTARMPIKLMTTEGDFEILSVSNNKTRVNKPNWYQKDGIGYEIQSYAGKLEFIAKATVNGRILLILAGKSIPDPENKSKRISIWIDYTKLTVNDKIIINELTPACNTKPYVYNIYAKANEEIKIQIEWLPHNK